jgi:transposase
MTIPGTAQNFLACDREQSFLLPPDVREWLPEDHLAWFVIDAVGVMDTARCYAAYREDGWGRAAYEPSMMIALLLCCWSRGVRSSRAIERACVEDAACRVIAHQRPDHATIGRFVERHEIALAELRRGAGAVRGRRAGDRRGDRDRSELYKQRAQLIEPSFGNTKHNRGFTRFARRGRSAARTEWRLMATTHNLRKLHQHFTAPAR